MVLSMRAGPIGPRTIAGGFILIPARQLLAAWRACRVAPLGVGDFRTWLACREMLARRCTLDDRRSPAYGLDELCRLTGVSARRARGSVARLIAAELLAWSDGEIGFPAPAPWAGDGPGDDALDDTIVGGRGPLIIPRRMLRLLAGGARPALIATALGLLLRCLARGRGGFKARGRIKASWISRAFGVDLRRVKQARKDLADLGWIVPEESDQRAENRWGRVYRIDLGWERAASPAGRRLPPSPVSASPQLPPPLLDLDPLREEEKDQELASGEPTGIKTEGQEDGRGNQLPHPAGTPSAESGPCPTREDGADACRLSRAAGVPEPGRAAAPTVGPPRLDDVRVEDLKDTGRLLGLLDQAIVRGLTGRSESDRLKFAAAAEHALAVGTVNPCGLFARLVRRGWWHFATQDDEDAASRRLKRHLFGAPSEAIAGLCWPSSSGRPSLSSDALLVREVKASSSRAGYRGDPFLLVRARDASWTRERWDRASVELERWRSGS